MNPIPLNDRGQFRYTDFVSYIPEFLQEEPDVVELLQVMSDYLNDAYRNIEDVEEFEFKLCTVESGIPRVRATLSRLRDMLDFASSRNERVCYLSVPRANVKTNVVFGKRNGYTPYYIDVGLSDIVDNIRAASTLDRKITSLLDGDVVFVNYVAMSPAVVRSYYYSKGADALILEPQGSTQDPFTGTPNTGNRLISFSVSDVSDIGTRYGGENRNNSYHEVLFTARIFDVQSEPAIEKRLYDVLGVGGAVDEVYIDYYGLNAYSRGQYNVPMTFYNTSGWEWEYGNPTGLFYLRDAAGSRYGYDDTGDMSTYASSCDQTIALSSERYALSEPVSIDATTGMCTFTTETCFPQSDIGHFYLSDKVAGTLLGEFVMEPRLYTEDKFVTVARPVWMSDLGEYTDVSRLCLVVLPLYFNRGVNDTDTSMARVHIRFIADASPSIDWKNARLERIEQSGTYHRTPLGKPFIMSTDRIYPDGQYSSIILPYDVYSELNISDDSSEVYCDGLIWDNGHATVTKIRPSANGASCIMTLSPDVTLSSYTGTVEVQLYRGYNGSLRVTSNGECICKNSSTFSYSSIIPGKTLAVCSRKGNRWISVINGVNVGEQNESILVLGNPPPEGWYDLILAETLPEKGWCEGLIDVTSESDGWIVCTCRSYSDDIFTHGIFRITDGIHSGYVDLGPGPDSGEYKVLLYRPGTKYVPGDTVYSSIDGKLYSCLHEYTGGELDIDPASITAFKVNTLARMRTRYAGQRNNAIPFYGQVKTMQYGEQVDYSGSSKEDFLPLYITKICENRLKYGWEHREFLNYGTAMIMNGLPRNGFLDVYSSARSGMDAGFETSNDIVTATIASVAQWNIDYPVIRRGVGSSFPVDIDNPVSLLAVPDGKGWVVTVKSAGHGLMDGLLIRVAGFDIVIQGQAKLDINGYYTVRVIDADTICFRVPLTAGMATGSSVQIPVGTGSIEYVGDYWKASILLEPTETAVEYKVYYQGILAGVSKGDSLDLVDLDEDATEDGTHSSYPVVVVDTDQDNSNIRVRFIDTLPDNLSHTYHIRKKANAGDYVIVGDDAYLVSAGIWEDKDVHGVAVPATLYSRQNIATVSDTNPEFAVGEDIVIDSIVSDGIDGAIVRLRTPIPHFSSENAGIINGRTMVRIGNTTPGEYNGWHTVTEVLTPKTFRITVRFADGKAIDGKGINNGKMILNEGRWYSYSINSVAWDKISNRVTYSLDNTVDDIADDTVWTAREHGLSAGDYVILGAIDDIVSLDYDNREAVLGRLVCCRVAEVIGEKTIVLVNLDGTAFSGIYNDGSSIARGASIARGLVLSHRLDDIGSFRGEYSMEINTLGGKYYRFTNGDIVVAAAQQNPEEMKAWRVVNDGNWQPVRPKRAMKIDELGLHSYMTGADIDSDGEDVEKYETYSDVDVMADAGTKYVAGFRDIATAKFTTPALTDMDTTRKAMSEYSSREDYSTVAPRYDMKPGFRGIPSMKYPLAEKIERLCYLRDATVIDYDLIEYLARYMGYDITAVGQDITESGLYRTKEERERTLREIIVKLPQYYALGGTKPGLHMLLAAFGVIGEALTLWTDASHPYQSMVYRDDVVSMMESGDRGKWVPTPYIDLRLLNLAKYPQLAVRQSDIVRIREQVKVFKPINVVFRDIMLQLVDTERISVTAALAGSGVSGNSGAVDVAAEAAGDILVVEYGDGNLNNCAF